MSFWIAIISLLATIPPTQELENGPARRCEATVSVRALDLYGSPISLRGPGGASFAEVDGSKRVQLSDSFVLDCGRHSITTFVGGGRNQTVTVELTEGAQTISIGVPVGWLGYRRLKPADGHWPAPLTNCPDAFLRAVQLYGQDSPAHGTFKTSTQVSFPDIEPGRYAVVPISTTRECRELPRFATVSNGKMYFALE